MKDYFRENVRAMEGYRPGLQPKERGWVKLNTNENPYPPSARVIDAIRIASADLRKYPDPMADEFRHEAARVLDVRPDQIVCGNGSDGVLTMIVRAFCGPEDKLAFPYPTYSLYPVLAEIQGCPWVEVDYPADWSLPLDLLETGAKLIVISNPNAPSADVAALATSFDGMVVVDEAYVDFARETALALVHQHENLIVTRSFSKSYSLAGLRFGFAVASEAVIAGLRKVKDSYNVSRPAIAGATAAMRDQAWMRENTEKVRSTRAVLTLRLRELGFEVPESETNFVLARCGGADAARGLYEALRERKILVRYFDLRGLDDCLRITVGTDREVFLLLEAIEDIFAAGGFPAG
jgi:histidinol-phosphate aminotransferase